MILDSRRCPSQAVPAKLQLGSQDSSKLVLLLRNRRHGAYVFVGCMVLQVWIIPIGKLDSPMLLRRANLLLAYTLPSPDTSPFIPKPISLPLVRILRSSLSHRYSPSPTPSCATGSLAPMKTSHEEEFFLCSARIELRGQRGSTTCTCNH